MPSFQYESLTSSGQVRNGVLSAPDRAEAVRQLLGRGETATKVDLAEPNGEVRADGPARRARPARTAGDSTLASSRLGRLTLGASVSPSDMANVIRELATAIEAGLPLMQSLRTVRRQAVGKGMIAMLDHLILRVEAGDALHQAARDYGPPFNDMMIGMLRAADASGEMSSVLHQLADLLERSLELRREVLGATFYPMIIAVLILISATILVTVVVPKLLMGLAASMELPLPTRVILGVADFISSYWAHCLIGIVIMIVAWRYWVRIPVNRFRVDRMKLRAPLIGRLLRDVAVARFTRTLGTLISAGLPILDALRITRDALGNSALMQAIDDVQDQVTSGRPLADPLERSGLFPPLLVQVVNLGERSGRLEHMLLHAANAFDRQVNTSIKLFTKALPPLLLIVMASLGGFVLAAILLPLLELQSMVS